MSRSESAKSGFYFSLHERLSTGHSLSIPRIPGAGSDGRSARAEGVATRTVHEGGRGHEGRGRNHAGKTEDRIGRAEEETDHGGGKSRGNRAQASGGSSRGVGRQRGKGRIFAVFWQRRGSGRGWACEVYRVWPFPP